MFGVFVVGVGVGVVIVTVILVYIYIHILVLSFHHIGVLLVDMYIELYIYIHIYNKYVYIYIYHTGDGGCRVKRESDVENEELRRQLCVNGGGSGQAATNARRKGTRAAVGGSVPDDARWPVRGFCGMGVGGGTYVLGLS